MSECYAQQRLVLFGIVICLIFVMSPFEGPSFSPFTFPVYWALMTSLLFLWLVGPSSESKVGSFELGLFALGIWMGISTFANEPTTMLPAFRFFPWLSGLVLAIYAARQYGRAFKHSFLRRLLVGVIFFEVLVAVIQLLVYRNGSPIVAPEVFNSIFDSTMSWRFMTGAFGKRLTVATGTYWTVNILGAWIAISLPLILAEARQAREANRRWFARFCTAVAVVAMLLVARNLTRGAFLGAVVGLLIYGAFRLGSGTILRSLLIWLTRHWRRPLVGLVLLVAIIFPFRGALVEMGGTRLSEHLGEDIGLRVRLVEAGISGVRGKPFLGWGHANYHRAMPKTVDIVEGLSERKEKIFGLKPYIRLSAHNTYLMLTHDAGLPALGLFLFTLFVLFRDFLRVRHQWGIEEESLAAAASAAMTMAFFYGTMYREMWPLFLLVLGCVRGATSLLSTAPELPRGGSSTPSEVPCSAAAEER